MKKILYIFSELQDSDMHWLASAGETRSFAPGQQVAVENAPLTEVSIVLEGSLRVLRGGVESDHLDIGEVIGDLSMLDSGLSQDTVLAVEDSKVFAIPQHRLRAKLELDPGFGSRFYRALSVFLNKRLHTAPSEESTTTLESALDAPGAGDELSDGMLDGIAAAGVRFDWFRQHVEGA